MIHEIHIEQLKLQVVCAIKIYAVQNKMSQTDMAYLLQTSQPRISNMYNGKLQKFSLDRLISWAYNLGIKATIQIN